MPGRPPLVEGIDYYLEDGKLVFKAEYHLRRGHCCNSHCRHCPYREDPIPDPVERIEIAAPAFPRLPGRQGKP